MRTSITQALVKQYKDGGDLWIYDTIKPGLVLRVRPSGANSYLVLLGRGKWYTLGRADVLKPEEARGLAQGVLGDVAHGKDPQAERRKRKAGTLRGFLDTQYAPWAAAHLKTKTEDVDRIRAVFSGLLDRPLHAITAFTLEQWRTHRRRVDDAADTTINRDLDALRSALTKAVVWGILPAHPMRQVKRAKVDTIGRLRYLTEDEEARLRQALVDRDETRRDGRRRFNAWRAARGYRTLPEIGADTYPDHMHPIVLLALNTGLRRGEMLALEWAAIDWTLRLLSVRGETAKSGMTRRIPMNDEAVRVLQTWRPSNDGALVFPGPNGERMESLKTAWAKIAKSASLKDFTFHDLRHTFASKLVMRGTDLNTVRELLGHADIKMTLRYAHLAPEHKAAAVAKLVGA